MITAKQIPVAYHDWMSGVQQYLIDDFGLDWPFADKLAVFMLYLSVYGVNFTIVSGYRSDEKQAALLKRWEEGDREGIAYKPALTSKHSITEWDEPDSHALDISSPKIQDLGWMAPHFGLKWGGNFRSPDYNHFYIDEL